MNDQEFQGWRFADPLTQEIHRTADALRYADKARKAMLQRGCTEETYPTIYLPAKKVSDSISRVLGKLLQQHVLWDGFLSEQTGTAGPLTARTLGQIRHPHRFPGQQCTKGHYVPPTFAVGDACPVISWAKRERDAEGKLPDSKQETCPGTMLESRKRINEAGQQETGVKSLWHFAKLFTDPDGRMHGYQSPSKGFGKKSDTRDWNGKLSSLMLMPDVGMAHQIVKHHTEPYFTETYIPSLERLAAREGINIDTCLPKAPFTGSQPPVEVLNVRNIARTITVKRWLGDLLMEWKRRSPLTIVRA